MGNIVLGLLLVGYIVVRYDDYFSSHAKQLKIFSESLRDELVKEAEKNHDRRG